MRSLINKTLITPIFILAVLIVLQTELYRLTCMPFRILQILKQTAYIERRITTLFYSVNIATPNRTENVRKQFIYEREYLFIHWFLVQCFRLSWKFFM